MQLLPRVQCILTSFATIQSCLSKLLLFGKMDFGDERRIAAEMYERSVVAGEILIKEGDTGPCWELPTHQPLPFDMFCSDSARSQDQAGLHGPPAWCFSVS